MLNLDQLGPSGEILFGELAAGLLGRELTDEQLQACLARAREFNNAFVVLSELSGSEEAQDYRKRQKVIKLAVPLGHFYSPIVDPRTLSSELRSELRDVKIDYDAMFGLFEQMSAYFKNLKFSEHASDGARYYWNNGFYGPGDALILAAMIEHFRPGRIVEVGSGFSSAVMLDTIERLGLATTCTFVDPYPGDRLTQLVSSADRMKPRILSQPIQEVPFSIFEELDAGDVLFLDTTHVSKTGSDVNHELFNILPRLKSGVIIHFHDVFDNFEYPDVWIFDDNRSWNEIYTLRAFLMNNDRYEVLMINDSIAKRFPERARELSAFFMSSAGGGLWLRKV